ncbi:MAG: hypothetical protein IPI95_09940 [Flavobacteriales bacterium]|nr:hypothetical protein [Flavobacteriales bacterium]
MSRNLLLALACGLAVVAAAQPTWRFHLAFEDGAGARDTIWMVYDTAATTGTFPYPGPNVDTLLGEGPVVVNDGQFHVFLTNALGDTTRTNAYPYFIYPSFDGTIIDAINWTPPMTIRWDTSLFHAPYLPYAEGSFGLAFLDGGYFFFHSNTGNETGYSMLITDSAFVNEDLDYLFPIPVYFDADNTIGVGEHQSAETALRLWPNPAQRVVHVQAPGSESGGSACFGPDGCASSMWSTCPPMVHWMFPRSIRASTHPCPYPTKSRFPWHIRKDPLALQLPA